MAFVGSCHGNRSTRTPQRLHDLVIRGLREIVVPLTDREERLGFQEADNGIGIV
jgi:hypothetical protein